MHPYSPVISGLSLSLLRRGNALHSLIVWICGGSILIRLSLIVHHYMLFKQYYAEKYSRGEEITELKLKIPSLIPPPNAKTVSNLQFMFDG